MDPAPVRPDRAVRERVGRERLIAAAIGLATAAIVLVPYATLGLPFRTALHVQAAAILAVVTAAAGLGLAAAGLPPPGARMPRGLALALALYGVAALAGAAVGLAASHGRGAVAGQLLSMALLPLGAVAGFALAPGRTWGAFALGLVGAAAAATVAHLAGWGLAVARGRPVLRLFLDNSVTLGGIALLALLVCLAAIEAPRGWARAGGWVGFVLLLLYLLGSAVRGLWVALLPSVATYALLAGARTRRYRAGALVAVAVLAGLAALAWGAHRWLEGERPNLLVQGSSPPAVARPPVEGRARPAGRGWTWDGGLPVETVAGPVAVPGPGTYRLRARVEGGSAGTALVAVRWRSGWGDRVGSLSLRALPFAGGRLLEAVGAAPPGAEEAELTLATVGATAGAWTVAEPRLERLGGPGLPTVLVAEAAYLDRRLLSLVSLAARPDQAPDASVATRRAETRAAMRRFATAPWARKLLGHGLGATLRPEGEGAAEQNYLHNFYAFLLFKLGISGTLLVGASLLLWLGRTAAWAWRAPPGLPRRFLRAAAGAWVGFLVLAVSSPEILNFRVAPVLGLLLAASAGAWEAARRGPAGAEPARQPASSPAGAPSPSPGSPW